MLDVREVRMGGMLVAYAKQELPLEQMEEVTLLLAQDLALGEELENIYIELERSGQI